MDYPGYGDFRGRREASVWQQLNRILRVLLALACILVIVSLFVPQHRRLSVSRAENDVLQTKVNEEQARLNRQTRQLALLHSDPNVLESMMRDKLDVMREGETIFHIDPSPKRK